MKITFLRRGHSNNSSSAHSLIFASQLPGSDESHKFGWQNFTCSSKEHKLNYLSVCLYSTWRSKYISHNSNSYTWDTNNELWTASQARYNKKLTNIQDRLFQDWCEAHIGGMITSAPEGYVDHQSMIYFPLMRDMHRINHEFVEAFINEFVNNNWYVFGGNDNEDRATPPTNDEVSNFEEFRTIWSFLEDTPEIICVKDHLTGEFVLSNHGYSHWSGSLLKIKFDAAS